MGEVYVYAPNADDLDCMGLCGALTPISCIHTEEANGMSEIEMEHPIDANGRWSFLLDGYSFDPKAELLLTIMSSLAQEESRSISENVTWGKRKRLAKGHCVCQSKSAAKGLPKVQQQPALQGRQIS